MHGQPDLDHNDAPPLDMESPEFYFWLRHARRSQEPVVALAAGSGRVAILLAGQEIGIIAVEPDASKRQCGIAAAAAAGVEITWLDEEPEGAHLSRKAGMIFLANGAFQSYLVADAQKTLLRAVYQNLQIGGKVALDLDVPDVHDLAASQSPSGAPLRPLPSLPGAGSGHLVHRWATVRYDLIEQRVSTHLIFEEVDSSGISLRRWHSRTEKAYLWPREMRLLLELSGFEVEALYGGWNDEPFDQSATRQIWVARKGI